jgi:RHS repeat-associated protein
MVSGISGVGNVTDDYGHDPLDQLVRARYALSGGTPVRDVQYSFDAVGNRTAVDDTGTNVSYTVNNLNQYTAVGGDSLTYDNNGNLATGAGLTLQYDAQGRLISAATATNAVSFIYDGRNRCVARTTVTATSGSTVWFIWGHEQSSHWGLLEERDADGDLVARYVHGEGIDEILRREAGASTVFYHHDALGSTIALTDGSGALVEQYRYDVYGLPTIMDASGADLGSRTSPLGNRFMFTGREWLSDLAIYDYRHRAHSPLLGRWLQPDPIGFAAGDLNVYRYCANTPMEYVDPWGLVCGYDSWGDYFVDVGNVFVGEIKGAAAHASFGLYAPTYENVSQRQGAVVGAGIAVAVEVGTGVVGGLKAAGKKAAGREFSHFIPDRILKKPGSAALRKNFGRSAWNGNYVPPGRHYRHDVYRWPSGWHELGPRLPQGIRQIDRIPNVYWGTGAGAVYAIGASIATDSSGPK